MDGFLSLLFVFGWFWVFGFVFFGVLFVCFFCYVLLFLVKDFVSVS